MEMLYQSDQFVVMQFEAEPPAGGGPGPGRGGYEIVDKLARREIFIDGRVAEAFARGVADLVAARSEPQAFEDFIGRYAGMAQQPLVMH